MTPPVSRTSTPATAAWLVAIAAGFALLVRVLSVGGGPVLWPFTDAFEYASMAHWMAHGEGAVLRIGPAFVPARVPPVLPVLLLPQAWLGGDPRHFWVPVFACGVAVVLGSFRLATAMGLGRSGALAAAALVAASPGVAAYSGFVMSDVPALATWGVVCACALRLARSDGADRVALVGGAFAAGLFVAFRVTNAAWLLPLALALPGSARRGALRRPVPLVAAAVLALLPLGLLALYQAHTFGSPLRTGYEFWLDESRFFAWRRVGRNLGFYAAQLAGLRSELLGRPLGYTSDLYALPVALLGAVGMARAMRRPARLDAGARRVLAAVAIGALLSVAAHVGFRWREGRFLLPLVPFAAIGCAFLLEELGARWSRLGTPGLAVWTVATSAVLILVPLPQPGPLVASLAPELSRVAARAPGAAGVEPTRLPLALAALFAPRAVVLVPSCDEPIGRDVQLELIAKNALRPLRIDPGQESVWAELPRWKENRCTKRSPSNARDTRPGSR